MNQEEKTLHNDLKEKIIVAAYKSVNELIKVLADEIISTEDYKIDDFRYLQSASDDEILSMLKSFVNKNEISADKMKNAVLAKKVALDDAFYILDKIEKENNKLNNEEDVEKEEPKFESFAERRSKGRS